ncbi:MAG: hypothetical protein COA42_07695 [Alteromonadaceae bacterium]|nr:MAG: hypothetical protein COA42_07695 [Alteromonadaceae bacterium]
MKVAAPTKTEAQDILKVPSLVDVKNEMTAVEKIPEESDIPENIKAQADEFINTLLSMDPKDLDSQQAHANAITSLGGNVETELVEQSKLLQEPMSTLMNDAENGSDVANNLLALEQQAREIDPNGYDLTSMSGFRTFLSKIGFPTQLTQWMAKYQSVSTVIKSIETGLRQGQGKLERDNKTLKDDQTRYRKTLFKLDDFIQFASYIDKNFEAKLESVTDAEMKRFLTDEILFPVRQRLMDLQTSKGVYQQAWITSEFIIKTNKELIRGVDRALKHTIIALGVAASLAVALAHQKRVHTALEKTKEVTGKMLQDIADKLLNQGADIMNSASTPFMKVEVMKVVFDKTIQAMDAVSNYRQEAIVSMKDGISEMKTLTNEMDRNIQRIEKGHAVKEQFKIKLD